MLITSIVLAVIAGIVTGWAARQREELLTQGYQIEALLVEITEQRVAAESNTQAGERVEELLVENTGLRDSLRSTELCLNMVLNEKEATRESDQPTS